MQEQNLSSGALHQFTSLLNTGDPDQIRVALMGLFMQPNSVVALRALDAAGVLTHALPELTAARHTNQPHVHFLPVLAHMLETVAAVEWLLAQLHVCITTIDATALPVALQIYPQLRYQSAYAAHLRQHLLIALGERYPRWALFKFAALLHDIGKPATQEYKPDGGVRFHGHQTLGGEMALQIAQRLGFTEIEADYLRIVVREHMRPGELAIVHELKVRTVLRFFRATDPAGPEVLLHLLADHMATRGSNIKPQAWLAQAVWIDALLDCVWGETNELPQPLVNGRDLMQALALEPSPLVGRLLACIGEAQANDEIHSVEEALNLARSLLHNWR